MFIPLRFASLKDGQEVFVWSDCLLDLGTDVLVGNVVFVWDALYLAVAPHLLGSYSSLQLFETRNQAVCKTVTYWLELFSFSSF